MGKGTDMLSEMLTRMTGEELLLLHILDDGATAEIEQELDRRAGLAIQSPIVVPFPSPLQRPQRPPLAAAA